MIEKLRLVGMHKSGKERKPCLHGAASMHTVVIVKHSAAAKLRVGGRGEKKIEKKIQTTFKKGEGRVS